MHTAKNDHQFLPSPTYSRVDDVAKSSGCSRPLIYKRIDAGLHVKPVKIHSRTSVFPTDEIEAQRKAEIFGLCETLTRQLVSLLEERRRHIFEDNCPTPQQVVRHLASLKPDTKNIRVTWEDLIGVSAD